MLGRRSNLSRPPFCVLPVADRRREASRPARGDACLRPCHVQHCQLPDGIHQLLRARHVQGLVRQVPPEFSTCLQTTVFLCDVTMSALRQKRQKRKRFYFTTGFRIWVKPLSDSLNRLGSASCYDLPQGCLKEMKALHKNFEE